MRRTPERFDYSMIESAIEKTRLSTETLTANPDFAVLSDGNERLFKYILSQPGPFIIGDYRFGIITRGELHAHLNLIEHHVGPQTIAFIAPGTIVQPIGYSSDLQFAGMALFRELPFAADQRPVFLNGSLMDFQLPVDEATARVVRQLFNDLSALARLKPFCRAAFDSMAATLLRLFDHIYTIRCEQTGKPSHQTDLFNRFLTLVNQHARTHHQLAFYANRLCLTERHLGSVVREVSGMTAKQWIDRALISEAKALLRHSNMMVREVARRLNFDEPTAFNRYFKAQTGLTPLEYRSGG